MSIGIAWRPGVLRGLDRAGARKGARIIALVGAVGLLSVAAHFAKAEYAEQPSQEQHRDEHAGGLPRFSWTRTSVELPSSQALFPAGEGAETANSQCLMCHSVEMVLLQPPLTEVEWRAEIEKMRKVYGSPLPAEKVDALAAYLSRVDGR